jgi:hypothetical protein
MHLLPFHWGKIGPAKRAAFGKILRACYKKETFFEKLCLQPPWWKGKAWEVRREQPATLTELFAHLLEAVEMAAKKARLPRGSYDRRRDVDRAETRQQQHGAPGAAGAAAAAGIAAGDGASDDDSGDDVELEADAAPAATASPQPSLGQQMRELNDLIAAARRGGDAATVALVTKQLEKLMRRYTPRRSTHAIIRHVSGADGTLVTDYTRRWRSSATARAS